jgi:hypothetical protein
LRAGWADTPFDPENADATGVHHLFGRPADGVFRKPRDETTDRSELAIWRTPVDVDGKAMWAGQIRHAIGRRYPLGERLFGVRLDPDVVEGRNYMLQSFWYAQTLDRWGYSTTGTIVPQASPKTDFDGNPWFSQDNGHAVIWLSDEPVPMNRTGLVEWPGPFEIDRGGS